MLSSPTSTASSHAANFTDKTPVPMPPAKNTSLPPPDSPETRALFRKELQPPHFLRRTWSGGDLRKVSTAGNILQNTKDLESEINSLVTERDGALEGLENMEHVVEAMINSLVTERDGALERLENMERVVEAMVGGIIQGSKERLYQKNESGTTPSTESKGVQTTFDSEYDQKELTAKSPRGGKKHDAALVEQTVNNLKNKLQQKDAQLSEKNNENKSLQDEVAALQQQLKDAQGDIRREKALTEVAKRFKDREINKINQNKDAEINELKETIKNGYKKEVDDTVSGLVAAMNLYAETFTQIDQKTRGPGFEEIQGILVEYIRKKESDLASRG